MHLLYSVIFFFNDTATTEIYTLSLHDALPIYQPTPPSLSSHQPAPPSRARCPVSASDRKSTRLNSSHTVISYAVFCLKKKKKAPPRRTSPAMSRATSSCASATSRSSFLPSDYV